MLLTNHPGSKVFQSLGRLIFGAIECNRSSSASAALRCSSAYKMLFVAMGSRGRSLWYSSRSADSEPHFMSYCGVVEARNLEDAFGTTCGRQAASKCCDCGTVLCSAHAQRCAHCNVTFCASCLSFHQAEHAKPAAAEKPPTRKRKSA